MEKISAAQVDHIMIKAASVLRSQESRIGELEGEIASFKRKEHAEKIASAAVDRGIMEVDEANAYANDLANSSDDLNVVENLVSRTAAGVALGQAHEKVAHVDGPEVEGTDVLTNFLLTSDIAG